MRSGVGGPARGQAPEEDSMSDELESLKAKLEEVERRAAIWRSQVVVLLFVSLLGGTGILLWTRASLAGRIAKAEAGLVAKRKVVEAEGFVVRGADGKVSARIGAPGLEIYDENGWTRTGLREGGLELSDEEGKLFLVVTSSAPKRTAALVFLSKDGSASLYAEPDRVRIPNLSPEHVTVQIPKALKVTP